jgi:hypothetical protein
LLGRTSNCMLVTKRECSEVLIRALVFSTA